MGKVCEVSERLGDAVARQEETVLRGRAVLRDGYCCESRDSGWRLGDW